MTSRGFQEIAPNYIEHQDLFTRTLGTDSDIVAKEMYTVSTTSGTEAKLVLRPELTASVVRIALENRWEHALPKRLWYHGALFRHERPQKGRYRQFHQIGTEFLGAPDVQGDLEMLTAGLDLLGRVLGREFEIDVQVNSIGDSQCREVFKTELKAWLRRPHVFSELAEEDRNKVESNPLRVLDSKTFQNHPLFTEAPQLRKYLSQSSESCFQEILNSLTALGIKYRVNPGLVRGLDYYNDFCFEIKPGNGSQPLNKQATILGGGRYDTLSGVLAKDPRKNIKASG